MRLATYASQHHYRLASTSRFSWPCSLDIDQWSKVTQVLGTPPPEFFKQLQQTVCVCVCVGGWVSGWVCVRVCMLCVCACCVCVHVCFAWSQNHSLTSEFIFASCFPSSLGSPSPLRPGSHILWESTSVPWQGLDGAISKRVISKWNSRRQSQE